MHRGRRIVEMALNQQNLPTGTFQVNTNDGSLEKIEDTAMKSTADGDVLDSDQAPNEDTSLLFDIPDISRSWPDIDLTFMEDHNYSNIDNMQLDDHCLQTYTAEHFVSSKPVNIVNKPSDVIVISTNVHQEENFSNIEVIFESQQSLSFQENDKSFEPPILKIQDEH